MDALTRDDLRDLATKQSEHCVSIFLPTERTGVQVQQNPIRFKNLMAGAEERLIAEGMRPAEARALLKPGKQLLDDSLFWQYQSDGLALFIAPDFSSWYRLPYDFEQLMVTAPRFEIKPLLPLFTRNGRLYILALSQNSVKLFHATHYRAHEVTPESIPGDIQEALKFDDPERQLQFHTGTGEGTGGKRQAMYHGQGASKDKTEQRLLRYFRRIDEGLHPLLREEDAPLVLAGVAYYFPIYREANTYKHLAEEGIQGSAEELDLGELHRRGWDIAQSFFLERENRAIDRYQQLAAKYGATSKPPEIIPACFDGRVDTLLVAAEEELWGKYDPQTRRVSMLAQKEPGTEDLCNVATIQTLLTSGSVLTLERETMPEDAAMVAIFRY